MVYKDGKTHETMLKKVILDTSTCVVIYSL